MTSIRRAGTASGAALSVLAMGLGMAHAVAPHWSRSVGLDVWNYSQACADFRSFDDRDASLEVQREKIRRETELAGHVATRVIEGRLSLAEAADELAPILKDRAGFDTVTQCYYKAPTHRHAAARYTITHIGLLLEDDPERFAQVKTRLEAEYAAMK